MTTHVFRLSLLLAIFAAFPTWAADQKPVTISHAWSRATAPGAPVGVAYFEIVNTGAADKLLRVESTVADEAQMHTVLTEGGQMQMRPMSIVDVPAKGRVRFLPGGLHVMLMGLKQPLKEGQRIPLTLVFEKAGNVSVQALVQGLGATTAPP